MQAKAPSKKKAVRLFKRFVLEEIEDNPEYTYKAPSSREDSEKEIESLQDLLKNLPPGLEDTIEASIVEISFYQSMQPIKWRHLLAVLQTRGCVVVYKRGGISHIL